MLLDPVLPISLSSNRVPHPRLPILPPLPPQHHHHNDNGAHHPRGPRTHGQPRCRRPPLDPLFHLPRPAQAVRSVRHAPNLPSRRRHAHLHPNHLPCLTDLAWVVIEASGATKETASILVCSVAIIYPLTPSPLKFGFSTTIPAVGSYGSVGSTRSVFTDDNMCNTKMFNEIQLVKWMGALYVGICYEREKGRTKV